MPRTIRLNFSSTTTRAFADDAFMACFDFATLKAPRQYAFRRFYVPFSTRCWNLNLHRYPRRSIAS